MPEPVMCPSCGETFGDYPADGKCTKCGGAIPAPAGRAPKGIDEELARLGGQQRTCPACGNLIPVGKRQCPECNRAPVQEHRHTSAWISLSIVALFAIAATTGTVMYMKKWAHKEHMKWVQDDMATARAHVKDGQFGDAIISLNQAYKELDWFGDDDLDRADLATQIETEKRAVRDNAELKVRAMIKEGRELEAEQFYKTEVKAIDLDGVIGDVVEKALASRENVRKFRSMLKSAQKLHEDGKLDDALREMSALRQQVADPYRSKGEAMAEIRKTVEAQQSAWVLEAFDRGMKALSDGKLDEAGTWFETAKQNVWASEVALRRRVEEVAANIAEKRVIGILVNVAAVRIATPEQARDEVLTHLKRKLADEGMLSLVLADRTDAKGAQLARLLVVDYREDKAGTFTSETRQKAIGTKVTARLKIVSAKDDKALWQAADAVTAQTGSAGGMAAADFNDANLRLDALRRFYVALDAFRMPSRDLMP